MTTLDFHHDQDEFASEVREYVARHASMDREEYKKELLGLDSDDEDEFDEMDDDGI